MSDDQRRIVQCFRDYFAPIQSRFQSGSAAGRTRTKWEVYLALVHSRLQMTDGAVRDASKQIDAIFRGEGDFASADEAFEHFARCLARELQMILDSLEELQQCQPTAPPEDPKIEQSRVEAVHKLLISAHRGVLGFLLSLPDQFERAGSGDVLEIVVPSDKMQQASTQLQALTSGNGGSSKGPLVVGGLIVLLAAVGVWLLR